MSEGDGRGFDSHPVHMGATSDTFQPPDPLVIFADDHRMLVRIRRDGTVEFGEDYTPTEAARIFWSTVAHMGWSHSELFDVR